LETKQSRGVEQQEKKNQRWAQVRVQYLV
jgi:hypothetical protein